MAIRRRPACRRGMNRQLLSEDLRRSARQAAGTANVREAVRELTLHALRSRLLTAEHIAAVARSVGEGIAIPDIYGSAQARESRRGAWTGLEDAVGAALRAYELAVREFADGRASLTAPEREALLAEFASMPRVLGERWSESNRIPAALEARIVAVIEQLRHIPAATDDAAGPSDASAGSGHSVELVASGVFLGLAEALRVPAARQPS